jgi:hypothetical protein
VPQETAPVEVHLGWGIALLVAGLVLCFTGARAGPPTVALVGVAGAAGAPALAACGWVVQRRRERGRAPVR